MREEPGGGREDIHLENLSIHTIQHHAPMYVDPAEAELRHRKGLEKAAAKGAAKASAAAATLSAGAWAERDLLEQDALLRECSSGGHLLVLRSALRNSALFSEELRAAARLVALPERLLAPLGGGLWVLRGAGDEPSAGALLAHHIPRLGGVRLRLSMVHCAATPSSLLERVRAAPPARSHACWSLRHEAHHPGGDLNLAPWTELTNAPSLAIGLSSILGAGFTAARAEDDADVTALAAECDKFVLLETKRALFLCREMPLERACAVGVARRPSPPPLSLPPWVGCWEHRPFAFSASLEPLIASAAVSIAANVHRAAGGEVVARRPLRLLDPCCGSGTVLAAGAALGLACRGSDLRDDFVCRARENLDFLGVAAEVAQHDALAPFPHREDPPDVIVSNPPWGKHIGGDEDGARILECVVREFPARSACCPREALAHPPRPPPLAKH